MKKIGITPRLVENDTYVEKREALDVRWGDLFNELNVIPIVLSLKVDFKKVISVLGIDGIILSGGNDLSSVSMDKNSKIRDEFEIALIEYAIKNKIPILGICRGMQLMTQHFGGKVSVTQGHTGVKHTIKASKDSKFYKELNDHKEVNSFHNYGITQIPINFRISASASNGTIEAMEHQTKEVLAIMWHPERNEPFDRKDISLIKKFFNA